MDNIQIQHERAVGDRFIEWYNLENGTHFVYRGRPTEAPDLMYGDNGQELNLEIGDGYYDSSDAAMRWKTARGVPNAPTRWEGQNFDRALVDAINARIREKCLKHYGEKCLLVINVSPSLTTADDMQEMLSSIQIPDKHYFDGIYLSGHFAYSTATNGGDRFWRLA